MEEIKTKKEKIILNEATTSVDFSTVEFSDSIIEVDPSTFDSFLKQITNYDIIDVPTVKIYNVISYFNRNDEATYYNSAIVELDAACTYNIGDKVIFNGIEVTVVYFEDKFVLLKMNDTDLDPFLMSAINLTDGIHTITGVNNNITYIKKMLLHMSGDEITHNGSKVSDAEYLNNSLKSVDLLFKSNTLETITRKIPIRLTREFVEDLKAILNEDAKDVVFSEVKDVIEREIEVEVLNYLRRKSQKYGTLVLKNGYGVQNSLSSVSDDIYAGIRQLSNIMISNIKRRKDIYIIADSTTCSLLLSSPLYQKASDDEHAKGSTLYQGRFGVFDLFLDPYAVDEYVMVGYKNKTSKLDAGLAFRIYNKMHIVETLDPENGNPTYWLYVRYGYVQNPQSTDNDNGSLFFSTFDVDSTGLLNFPLTRQNS